MQVKTSRAEDLFWITYTCRLVSDLTLRLGTPVSVTNYFTGFYTLHPCVVAPLRLYMCGDPF